MNIRQMADKIKKELEDKQIDYTEFSILETKWGYVAETKPKESENSFISLFYDNGEAFLPFTKGVNKKFPTPGIYFKSFEEREQTAIEYWEKGITKIIEEEKGNHPELFNQLPFEVDADGNISLGEASILLYKELDENYFIIQVDGKKMMLFYVEEDNQLTYCGMIDGEVFEFNEQLAKKKCLLVKNNNQYKIFSWKQNKVVSDTWSKILTNQFYMGAELKYIENMQEDIREYFQTFIEKNKALLAILELEVKATNQQKHFFAVIDSTGKALTDLMYITNLVEIKSLKLKGEPIGTLNTWREQFENHLEALNSVKENNAKKALASLSMLVEGEEYEKLEESRNDFNEEDVDSYLKRILN